MVLSEDKHAILIYTVSETVFIFIMHFKEAESFDPLFFSLNVTPIGALIHGIKNFRIYCRFEYTVDSNIL
jgi:hypothetical protein